MDNQDHVELLISLSERVKGLVENSNNNRANIESIKNNIEALTIKAATDNEDRQHLWKKVDELGSDFQLYKAQTNQKIDKLFEFKWKAIGIFGVIFILIQIIHNLNFDAVGKLFNL